MKLEIWTDLINELKTLSDIDIEALTVVETPAIENIAGVLKTKNYNNPVTFDPEGIFNKVNSLPLKSEHHCYLLDAENKIIAIGNPVFNPKIKDIYRQSIKANIEQNDDGVVTSISAKPLGVVHPGRATTQTFFLNIGDLAQCTLQAIIPSCDCLEANVVPHPDPGVIKVDVTFTADSIVGAFTRYVDIFFNEKDAPNRLIVYGYIK